MYHLFNSVYVDTEWRINRRGDYITVSPSIGFEYIPGPNEETGEHLGYACSLDDMSVETFKSIFVSAYANRKRTMVYADGETYLRLYAMLVKSILPSVDFNTFTWIMVCKKATFNVSMTNTQKPQTDFVDEVAINRANVERLYRFDDPFQDTMNMLVDVDPDAISFEWRILHLKAEGIVGTLPVTMKHLLRRIALANTYDALDVWGRAITDPFHWEFAGCDLDTLLDAPSVFQGAMNMIYTNNPMFLKPGVFKTEYDDEWIKDLLRELIPMLERCVEGPTHDRSVIILEMMEADESTAYDPDVCLARLMTMFHGQKRLALPNYDAGKFDENLIRFILSADSLLLRQCLKGAVR